MVSTVAVRRTGLPGGPTTITSSKVKMPEFAWTDLDLRTVTFVDYVLIIAILELSVIIGLFFSSRSIKLIF